jgi:hypothetical protein
VEPGLERAAEIFRGLGVPFYLAVAELDRGEWLSGQGRSGEAEPLLSEAQEIFERLGAAPWLERLASVRRGRPEPQAVLGR